MSSGLLAGAVVIVTGGGQGIGRQEPRGKLPGLAAARKPYLTRTESFARMATLGRKT